MAIEEKEDQELTKLQDLIDLVEKDPLPTNVFTIEDTDPLVLLGKLNEIEEYLRGIKSLIVDINSKSMEAVNTALDAIKVAKQALDASNTALASANTALETANQAITTANTSLEQATDANNTAGDALAEADDAKQLAQTAMNKAQEALDQVTQGLGTKVYDNHGTLLSTAKFAGHNGINVDMAENDPQTFDIRLDNTITTAIEDTHQQTETNKANITALESRTATNETDITNLKTKDTTQDNKISANEADIVELTNMLSATEELAQQATEDLLKTIPVYSLGGYDPDTLYNIGLYEITADAGGTNCPDGSNYGVLLVLPYRKPRGNTIVDFCCQIYLPNGDITTYPNTLFYRTGLKNSWNEWQKITDTPQVVWRATSTADYSALNLKMPKHLWGKNELAKLTYYRRYASGVYSLELSRSSGTATSGTFYLYGTHGENTTASSIKFRTLDISGTFTISDNVTQLKVTKDNTHILSISGSSISQSLVNQSRPNYFHEPALVVLEGFVNI